MSTMSRRRLLKSAALGAAGAMAVPYLIPSGVLAADGTPGANELITVGAIGVGGRATLLLEQLPEAAQIVALCDCNLPRAEQFANHIHSGHQRPLDHFQRRRGQSQIQRLQHLGNFCCRSFSRHNHIGATL